MSSLAIYPLIVNIEVLAQILDISPKAIKARVKRGTMPQPQTINGHTAWRAQAIYPWVEQQLGMPLPVDWRSWFA